MKFLADEPALLDGRTLVVSDLHIGIEHEYWQNGIKVPSQTEEMKKRLDSLLRKSRASRLMICGDLKHKVPGTSYQELKEIPDFLNHFSKKVPVEIVQGNHDADLKPLLPSGVMIYSTKGILIKKTFFTHGHTWPDPSFLRADFIVMGHVQPQIEIRDKLGYVWRERVWVRGELDKKKVKEKYGSFFLKKENKTIKKSELTDNKIKKLPELIILPSFNPMAGGLALNKKDDKKENLSPILKLANLKTAKITLLNGTFLGELGKI